MVRILDRGRQYKMKEVLPTFLGIGALKSGTTAVQQFLLSHPQIFLPVKKELRYFAYAEAPFRYRGPGADRIPHEIIRTWEEYTAVFNGSGNFTIRGEISPQYMLLAENAAPQIFQRLPGVKLFAVLRNPADRAYSNFLQTVRMGIEPLRAFRDALDREPERTRDNWLPIFWYKRNGLYHRQLTEFYSRFPEEQIRIYLYDDLRRDPGAFLADLYRYLGANPNYQPDFSKVFNPSGIPRRMWIYRLLRRVRNHTRFIDGILPIRLLYPIQNAIRNNLLLPAPKMSHEIRRELIEYYREEIIRLQNLIGRDLGAWMEIE
jgi:hypothetical protein